jgi:hypothetical protein
MKAQSTALSLAALCLLAHPALAQAPECGGIGADGAWIGGTPEASDPAMAADALTLGGVSVPLGAPAVALFTLSAPMPLRLEAASANGDPVLELYDASGALIVTDDDSGGGLDSRAETELAPGGYCLAVRGFGGSTLAADIRVGRLEHEPLTVGLAGGFFEPGGGLTGPEFVGIHPCTADTPAVALTQGPIEAALDLGGAQATGTVTDTPYYRFTLATPQSLSLRAYNEAADPYIYLFDGSGALLAENDDYDSLNSRIDMTDPPLQPGTYCVGMRALTVPHVPVTHLVRGFVGAGAAA